MPILGALKSEHIFLFQKQYPSLFDLKELQIFLLVTLFAVTVIFRL